MQSSGLLLALGFFKFLSTRYFGSNQGSATSRFINQCTKTRVCFHKFDDQLTTLPKILIHLYSLGRKTNVLWPNGAMAGSENQQHTSFRFAVWDAGLLLFYSFFFMVFGLPSNMYMSRHVSPVWRPNNTRKAVWRPTTTGDW